MSDNAPTFAALRNETRQYNSYLGTSEQLIAAGVIGAELLARPFPNYGEMSALDDIGVRVYLRRRIGGRIRVRKVIVDDQRSAATIEKAVGGLVADILKRFVR